MATIINTSTKEKVYLQFQHTFGRGADNSTKINIPDVSNKHATIFWQAKHWNIKDHSRNGTIINRNFIHNQAIRLNQDDLIKFGKDSSAEWKIEDLSPPLSYLKSLMSDKLIILKEVYYALPDKRNPEIEFLRGNNQWTLRKNGKALHLEDLQTFELGNERWVFVKNNLSDETVDYGRIKNDALFAFRLSANQEQVRVKIIVEALEMDLGERSYNLMLLILARKRQEDIQAGYSPKNQGWMWVEHLTEQLSKEELREIDQYNLNVRIYRLKQQLLKLQPYGSQFVNIIERRRGEVRFNHENIEIEG